MGRDGKSEMELQIVQQETDDILSSVSLLSESFFEGGDGDVEDSAFGIGLELVVAVDGEIGACWEVGFVAAACLTAEVVDGGIFFVAADAGIVAADLCGQAAASCPLFAGSCLPHLRRAGFVSIAVRPNLRIRSFLRSWTTTRWRCPASWRGYWWRC